MNSRRVTRVLCAADPRGSTDAIERLTRAASERDVHAVAVVGDLSGGGDRAADYRTLFKALGQSGHAAYWVPGGSDAPVAEYLREAHNMELVFANVRGVHGTAAISTDAHVLFSGFGGEVDDDPDAARDESERLHYPRWEPEYRLKILREFDELQMVLLFATPPLHRGHGTAGSDALKELIATYRARLVVCGGERGTELIGRTLVVCPGSLADGHYALADLHTNQAELQELAATA